MVQLAQTYDPQRGEFAAYLVCAIPHRLVADSRRAWYTHRRDHVAALQVPQPDDNNAVLRLDALRDALERLPSDLCTAVLSHHSYGGQELALPAWRRRRLRLLGLELLRQDQQLAEVCA